VFRGEDRIEIDHVTPTAAGGRDMIENLQALHRHCHSAKTAQDGSSRPCAGGYA
jgi:RNA-directed DNA polymerase